MAFFRIYDAAGVGLNSDIESIFPSGDDFDVTGMDYDLLSDDRARFSGMLDNGLSFRAIVSDIRAEPALRSMDFLSNGAMVMTLSQLRIPVDDDSGFDRILAGADEMIGNRYADVLEGEGGNDILRGGGGNDRLRGGDGNDLLQGGAGADKLNGGVGKDRLDVGLDAQADTIVFSGARHSAVGRGRDVVVNFDRGEDHVDLRALDARSDTLGDDAFLWGGQTRADRSLWWVATDSGVILKGDLGGDGDSRADFEIMLNGIDALSKGDILL
ncbi:calcium-binding protein [Rubellimicrobium roseum]|uniref:Calcium-binding protein n=1 Tax=Rubellimicrobium roseum TaxID=687525 RepID=A0A5C4NG88_9RHOB|nr:M10 family metallopeptidase C-terminal domain-containing protein [Rubellimicrobium roseum]TNC72980.1 hypothetical protein FHG71_06690 [Rubellimicrobium roseum]